MGFTVEAILGPGKGHVDTSTPKTISSPLPRPTVTDAQQTVFGPEICHDTNFQGQDERDQAGFRAWNQLLDCREAATMGRLVG
jgi:hypothetical protein